MTTRPKPAPDESPSGMTARRMADALEQLGRDLAATSIRLLTHRHYLPDAVLGREYESLRSLAERLADASVSVRVGAIPIQSHAGPHSPPRPLIDFLESKADGAPAPEKPARRKREKPPPIAPDSIAAAMVHALHTDDREALAALAAARPIPGAYVYWSGRNPVYGIRADSLEAATARARTQHPKDAKFEIRPDDGTIAARGLAWIQTAPGVRHASIPENGSAAPRAWIVRDREGDRWLGRFTADNLTRAEMEAERRWPDVPRKRLDVRPAPSSEDDPEAFREQFDGAAPPPAPARKRERKARVAP